MVRSSRPNRENRFSLSLSPLFLSPLAGSISSASQLKSKSPWFIIMRDAFRNSRKNSSSSFSLECLSTRSRLRFCHLREYLPNTKIFSLSFEEYEVKMDTKHNLSLNIISLFYFYFWGQRFFFNILLCNDKELIVTIFNRSINGRKYNFMTIE